MIRWLAAGIVALWLTFSGTAFAQYNPYGYGGFGPYGGYDGYANYYGELGSSYPIYRGWSEWGSWGAYDDVYDDGWLEAGEFDDPDWGQPFSGGNWF